MAKNDSLKHMRWQVKHRSKNQECCLELYELLDKYPARWRERPYFLASQHLVGAAFSLWRAVFLGNKTAKLENVFTHSKEFLEAVILDNTVTFNLDKNKNEWTFNYYTSNARFRLESLAQNRNWKKLVPMWDGKTRGTKARWEYAQEILSLAVRNFDKHLSTKKRVKALPRLAATAKTPKKLKNGRSRTILKA